MKAFESSDCMLRERLAETLGGREGGREEAGSGSWVSLGKAGTNASRCSFHISAGAECKEQVQNFDGCCLVTIS